MSMDTNETDLDLIYMSDWSADMHGQDANGIPPQQLDQQQQNPLGSVSNDISTGISYANVFPGIRDDDGETISSNTPMPFGLKRNVIPTITTIYEPKFYEIYQQYYQFISQSEPELIIQSPNQHHLMSLCMNYLLSFSNWARDSVNGHWIRATLFENPDMRPEVRNGLAMIIVYVFAAAKAADARFVETGCSIDMFTVLMKAESGMGIVNKTSLKIYSDPFGYFNFIKTCISGLIDASAIPENERISTQATKKSRRGSRNKDEVEAYDYVKNQLIAMFQSHDSLQLAKDRINQILEFWHLRGKTIRNERFTSVFSLPPPVPGGFINSNNDNAGASSTGAPIMNTLSSEYITFPGRNSSSGPNRSSNRSSQGSTDTSNLASAAGFYAQQQGNINNNNNSMYAQPNSLQSYQQHSHFSPGGYSSNPPQHLQINDNDSVVSDSGMSSASRSPHPSFIEYHSGSARSSGAMNFRYTNTTIMSAAEENSVATSTRPTESSLYFYQQQFAQFQQQQLQIAQTIPIPALRFDRQGMLSWSVTTFLIYDLDTLLQQNHGRANFYLVDEQKLKHFLVQEILSKNGQSSLSDSSNLQALEEELMKSSSFSLDISYAQAGVGLGSMEKLLMKSNAVATSWLGAADSSQLRVFVEAWRNHIAASVLQQQQNTSVLGRRSASNSHVYTPPNGGGPMLTTAMMDVSSAANGASNNNAAATTATTTTNAAANNSSAMLTDDVSVSSGRQPRLSRRRTTGGMDLKRDMAKLMQLQQQEQQLQAQASNSHNYGAVMFSPPKGMSPAGGGPSPPFTFNHKTIAAGAFASNGSQQQQQQQVQQASSTPLTSPVVGNSERRSFNNNSTTTGNNHHNFGSFNSNSTSNMSMLDYWQLLNTGRNSFSGSTNRGIIVFERSNEVGLVVRANANYGLAEDLWCLYYPDDAMQQFLAIAQQYDAQDRLAQSFAAYLMQLLPQLRILMQYLAPNGQSIGGAGAGAGAGSGGGFWQGHITVSYFAHIHAATTATATGSEIAGGNASSLGPPPAPISMQQYRTLGSADQNAHLLLSRLASDAYFHEIMLI